MMLRKVLLSCTLFSFILTAYANDINIPSNKTNHYFIALSAGPGWTNAGRSQTISLESDVVKRYVPRNLTNSNVLINGELFLGYQTSFFDCIQSQFGLAVYASNPAKLNGYIQEDADPNFQNYEYGYKISHQHLALKTKWIAENPFNMNPYLSVSVGVGWNHSYDFSITPLIFEEIPAPPFESHSNVAFSYTFGVGFQHTVNSQLSIGLGYEFASWGNSSLSRAEGQTAGHGLRLSNLYTQDIEFNVSYIL